MTKENDNGQGLPAWLDNRTIALISTVLIVGASIAALILHSSAATNARIENMHRELSTRIENVRAELSKRIEDVRKELQAEINAVESRLRLVELEVAAIRTKLGLAAPLPEPVPPLAPAHEPLEPPTTRAARPD